MCEAVVTTALHNRTVTTVVRQVKAHRGQTLKEKAATDLGGITNLDGPATKHKDFETCIDSLMTVTVWDNTDNTDSIIENRIDHRFGYKSGTED